VAQGPPGEESLLASLDRQNRQRLSDQLRRSAAREGGELSAGGLAGVLFDVLVEGGKEGTEASKQLDEVWERLEGNDEIITRRTFEYEAFMVGAFGTIVAIDLGLEGDDKARVLAAFEREPGSLVHRFRKAVPGAQRFRWYMAYYDEALGPERHPDRTWYVPTGLAFVAACREQALDRGAFEGTEPQVAAAGLEVFLRAVSGTIDAVRGWTIV
jgi:hypothetical protein